MCKNQETQKAKAIFDAYTCYRRVLWQIWVVFEFICKFLGDIVIPTNGKMFNIETKQMGRRTNEQRDMFRYIPNLKLAKNWYTLWAF